MRSLIKKISDRLQTFVEQRDDIALVVLSPERDALPILEDH
jgi:hypothetical protein